MKYIKIIIILLLLVGCQKQLKNWLIIQKWEHTDFLNGRPIYWMRIKYKNKYENIAIDKQAYDKININKDYLSKY